MFMSGTSSFARKMLGALALVASSMLALPAHANLIQNGGFELSDSSAFPFNHLASWTYGNVDAVAGLWNSYDGIWTVDLNGSAPGYIQQDFSTAAGQTYQLQFALTGNYSGCGIGCTRQVQVTAGDLNTVLSATQAATYSFSDPGWQFETLLFTAQSSTSTLKFASYNTPGASGPVIDAVSVTALPVPEPETYAMMLAGLGLMGFVARRRKQIEG
jgi:choice-of-anchor C domain-containing protein